MIGFPVRLEFSQLTDIFAVQVRLGLIIYNYARTRLRVCDQPDHLNYAVLICLAVNEFVVSSLGRLLAVLLIE